MKVKHRNKRGELLSQKVFHLKGVRKALKTFILLMHYFNTFMAFYTQSSSELKQNEFCANVWMLKGTEFITTKIGGFNRKA